jgi:signal transduction histidine kinase
MTESTLTGTATAESIASNPSTSQLGPSKVSFVEEIRRDRLSLLWKATMFGSIVLVWLVLVASTGGRAVFNVTDFIVPLVIVITGSLLTRYFLKQNQYNRATWAYSLGIVFMVVTLMLPDSDASRTLVPSIGVLVVFILGMLMSVRETIGLAALMVVSMIAFPLVLLGDFAVTSGGAFGLLLIGISTMFVTQVSGELYGIAEWALDSYRKERKTADQLHESRQEVEKSLLKQQNLTLQLQNINTELEDARRAAEMAKQFRGQFLANMSHELRTPLNAVIGFSETMLNFPMMYNGVELPPEYRQDMERIYGSGKHLLGIINDILDLSRIDVGRLEVEIQPVELEPIISNLMSTTIGLIGSKPIELKRDLPEVMPMVLGDPLRVRQVLLNLYSNAAKFTDKGHIRISVETKPETVVVALEDTGTGISPDNVKTIFEAFQQGDSGRKQKRAGSGLGLAISRQLLELMDGDIWLESEPGKGSIFYVAFPRYRMDADTEWEEVAEVTASTTQGKE